MKSAIRGYAVQMATSSAPAVLFDIDGTLVDSNYLHVHAWVRAFHECDIATDAWRIHHGIGMDGSALVDSLSNGADSDVQERLSELHSRYYAELTPLLRVLPGGRQILKDVASRGLQVVLATSAPEDELAVLRRVLDSDDVVSAITSSEDVDAAKPHPGIIEVALDRTGVTADRAVFVGDSVWDAKAAARAGVSSIGVLSGGIAREDLTGAGAAAVFSDVAELLAHVGDTAIAELMARV
jgi:HAD superfamily hydrolase (TIGR01509 family)